MNIKQFVWGAVDSNSWMIVEGKMALIIDAVDSSDLYEAIGGLDAITIVLTHSHFDHIGGLNKMRKLRPDMNVIATKICSENIGNSHKNMSSIADAFMTFYQKGNYRVSPISCKPADISFDNSYEFDWCGHTIKLIAVHGHSDDSLLLTVDDILLFSGDTLLSIPTITRFPRGNSIRFLTEDIPLIKKMKNIVSVYPGHGDIGKIDDMLKNNVLEKLNLKGRDKAAVFNVCGARGNGCSYK